MIFIQVFRFHSIGITVLVYHGHYVWIVFRGRYRFFCCAGCCHAAAVSGQFFPPLSYTGLIVVYSISNMSFNTISSSTDVLHLSESLAVASSSSSSMRVKARSLPFGFSPAAIRGSEDWVYWFTCSFSTYNFICVCYYCFCAKYRYFSLGISMKICYLRFFFLEAFITIWSNCPFPFVNGTFQRLWFCGNNIMFIS